MTCTKCGKYAPNRGQVRGGGLWWRQWCDVCTAIHHIRDCAHAAQPEHLDEMRRLFSTLNAEGREAALALLASSALGYHVVGQRLDAAHAELSNASPAPIVDGVSAAPANLEVSGNAYLSGRRDEGA